MRNAHPRTIDFYQIPNGHEPFTRWFRSIRDTSVRRRIQARLIAIETGNLGTENPSAMGFGNYDLTSGQAIVSIMVK